jgi:CHASE3 domain sensor protein
MNGTRSAVHGTASGAVACSESLNWAIVVFLYGFRVYTHEVSMKPCASNVLLWIVAISLALASSFLVILANYNSLALSNSAENEWEDALSVQARLGDLSTVFYRSVANSRQFLITNADVDLARYRHYRDETYSSFESLRAAVVVPPFPAIFSAEALAV